MMCPSGEQCYADECAQFGICQHMDEAPTQPSLFDPPPIRHCDPNLEPVEIPRVGGQCLKILRRLVGGPATNRDLADISLKYTGRVSDLRKSGFRIPKPDWRYTC